MVKKKEIDPNLEKIKKNLDMNKIIIGTAVTLKKLKKGDILEVFMSSNCPNYMKEDINYYAGLAKAKVVELKYPNDELGLLCKKPFPISVLGLSK